MQYRAEMAEIVIRNSLHLQNESAVSNEVEFATGIGFAGISEAN